MKLSMLVLALGFIAQSSFAMDRCESDFRRGIAEMKQDFMRMSPVCRKEVDKGDSNRGNIMKACDSNELSMALDMQGIKNSRLAPLCHDSACTSIQRLGVCVDNMPFTYYLRKLGM